MAHSRSTTPKLVALTLALLCSVLTGPHGARAQTTEQPPLTIGLVSQPLWHEPGDTLGIRVRVTNRGDEAVEGFGIRVGVFDRVRSRSALHDFFDVAPGTEPYVQTRLYKVSLEPGASESVLVDNPMADFGNLVSATDGGVFPITLAISDLQSPVFLDWVTTPLIYYPEKPVDPLELITVVPLAHDPSMSPDGSFATPSGGAIPLQRAALPDGWLLSLIDELAEKTAPPPDPEPAPPRKGERRSKKKEKPKKEPKPPRPLHVAVAPDPRLLEELAALADGFRTSEGEEFRASADEAEGAAEALRTLRTTLSHSGVQTLLVPYAFPNLTNLAQLPDVGAEQILEHLSEGASVAKDLLPLDPDVAWLLPPEGQLDSATLESLQLGDRAGRIASISESSLAPTADPENSGCPEPAYTFACPASITNERGTVKGFIADGGLAERLAPLGGTTDRLTLQQFFAETSMIREEQPGIAGRVVQATLPSGWEPAPHLTKLLLKGLQLAPWLRSVTPSEALRGDPPAAERTLVEQLPSSSAAATFFESDIVPAREIIESYANVAIEEIARVRRLKNNLLVAQSYMESDPETASEYADSSSEEALGELGKISIIGVDDVTLTSSRGRFQLVLANGTDSVIDVDLEFESPQLAFDPELLERLSTTYEPGNHPLTITATARSSGKSPLTVTITSPGSGIGYQITEKVIDIRSTAFNNIALGITVGALLFLILFYLVRALRRRSRAKGTPEADPA